MAKIGSLVVIATVMVCVSLSGVTAKDDVPACWTDVVDCMKENVDQQQQVDETWAPSAIRKVFCCPLINDMDTNCFCNVSPVIPVLLSDDPHPLTTLDSLLYICTGVHGALKDTCPDLDPSQEDADDSPTSSTDTKKGGGFGLFGQGSKNASPKGKGGQPSTAANTIGGPAAVASLLFLMAAWMFY